MKFYFTAETEKRRDRKNDKKITLTMSSHNNRYSTKYFHYCKKGFKFLIMTFKYFIAILFSLYFTYMTHEITYTFIYVNILNL